VLHVAPHADDEAIGAGATLLTLKQAEWNVVDLIVSFGRPHERDQREREARDAARRAGYDLVVPDEPIAIGRNDDHTAAQQRLAATIERVIAARQPAVVISPSPHDGHHGHETVGRAVRTALEARDHCAPRWWIWGLWADLPFPNLFHNFDSSHLVRLLDILDAYESQIQRNDYRQLVTGRAMANAVLGSERVFGYGAPAASSQPYAELLTDTSRSHDRRWRLARPRLLDAHANPHAVPDSNNDITPWLDGR
jgi:LmbE family N-acetylglucosaminyl deacetylase